MDACYGAAVADRIEVPTRDAIFRFDPGERVLEVFGIGPDGSARYRVEMLRDFGIDDVFVRITCPDTTILNYIVDESQRPQIQELVSAVAAARSS